MKLFEVLHKFIEFYAKFFDIIIVFFFDYFGDKFIQKIQDCRIYCYISGEIGSISHYSNKPVQKIAQAEK